VFFSERSVEMPESRIVCPKCKTSIKLTESLAAPLIATARRRLEQQLAKKEKQLVQREANFRNSQKAIAQAQKAVDEQIAKKLRREREAISKSEAAKARLSFGAEIEQRDTMLAELQNMQSDLDRERKAMARIWAKRDQQLKSVLDSSAGLYGDLQGIAGRALPEIERLGFLLIGNAAGTDRPRT
jgi:hypothetical protein